MANTYCALYRKYRPENLDDVVGQNVIVKTLKHAIENNCISHAYLFTGPRGTGKTSIAKILAKTINCTNLNNSTPCNVCISCTQTNNKQNVDIIEIDAASNNGVDEIREIRNKVTLVPSISKYKVYIIDEVHMLTTGAFNALLKTLEEPPSHIIFILATTEPHKIPNTILSRCQRFDFKRISVEDIFCRLKYICVQENISVSDDALKEIALSSDGGMRDAIGTLDQVISYAEDNITVDDVHEINGTLSAEELSDFIDKLLNCDLNCLLTDVDKFYNNGKNIVKMVEEIVIFLKNILLFKTAPLYFKNNQYKYDLFKKYENVNVEQIIKYISDFMSELREIKKSNLPKFLFELLLIKSVNKYDCLNSNEPLEKKTKDSIPDMHISAKKTENEKTIKPVNLNKTTATDYSKLQNIRVANTLSRFNKNATLTLRSNLENLNELLMNPDLSQYVSIILDGQLKAASDEYIIFVLETKNSADLFNDNIVNIEMVLENYLSRKYKVIGVDNNAWEIIKNEFNNKIKVFEYTKENELEDEMLQNVVKSTKINVLDELFGDTIVYEN